MCMCMRYVCMLVLSVCIHHSYLTTRQRRINGALEVGNLTNTSFTNSTAISNRAMNKIYAHAQSHTHARTHTYTHTRTHTHTHTHTQSVYLLSISLTKYLIQMKKPDSKWRSDSIPGKYVSKAV